MGLLSVSNSRVTLSLQTEGESSSFHPGSIIHPVVTFHGKPEYESLSLTFEGHTTATIMGLDRWQAGQQANLGFGGNGMLITSKESLEFLAPSRLQLISQSGGYASGKDEKEEPHDKHGGSFGEGTYEYTIPHAPNGQLLPSFKLPETDPTGVSVIYSITLKGARKGFLKSNDKLVLEIPISIPLPDSPLPLRSSWPTATASKVLKFEAADSPLSVSATLSHLPLTTTKDSLKFHISLIDPQGLVEMNKDSLVLSPFFARKVRTTPIDDPNSGKEFDWAGIRVAVAKDGFTLRNVGGLEWEGEIQVPHGEKTVISSGVGVEYVFTIKITSQNLFIGSFAVHSPVFIPSSEVVATTSDLETYSGASEMPPPSYA